MKTIGLDIGTTTVSAAAYDSELGVVDAAAVKNNSFLSGESFERIQDPAVIYSTALSLLRDILSRHPDAAAIGMTGQMHGMLYLNAEGVPVSPLYTWQDCRGDLPFGGGWSYCARLSGRTGCPLATGYGMVTHFYNLQNKLVPAPATQLCTIHDYVAMRLSGRTRPLIDPSDAASLGLYDAPNARFGQKALAAAGISPEILPEIAEKPCLGVGELGLPVYVGIGDNQASFLGATAGRTDALLVNVGTGSQVSVYSPDYLRTDSLETRPFPDGGWLLAGASLCGGRSYAMLEEFFRKTVELTGAKCDSFYPAMSAALNAAPWPENVPVAVTTFQGTRRDPSLRGSISGIGADNFTPLHFMYAVMRGMAVELYGMFRSYLDAGGGTPAKMVGSGNGLRQNPQLRRIFEQTFSCPLTLSANTEEAACGAALYALRHSL